MPTLTAPPDPGLLDTGWLTFIAHLAALGVQVVKSPLPGEDLLRWDPRAAIVHIRKSAPLAAQAWAVGQFILALTVGIDVTPLELCANLRLVS